MWDANVGTTTRVLDAAAAAGVPRIVYVSTVKRVRQHPARSSTSRIGVTSRTASSAGTTRTKYRARGRGPGSRPARRCVSRHAEAGLRAEDHSTFGEQLAWPTPASLPYRRSTTSAPVRPCRRPRGPGSLPPWMGRGPGAAARPLRTRTTLHDAIARWRRLGGRKPPALRLPTRLLQVMAPVGGLISASRTCARSSRRRRA
jgi:hypothetical protein